MSEDGMFIYHVGIIDYLQDFNIEKWGENKYKSLISDGNLISAVPPRPYCKRYFAFMQNQVIINQNTSDISRKEIRLDSLLGELRSNSIQSRKKNNMKK